MQVAQFRVQATLSNLTLHAPFIFDRYKFEPIEDGQKWLRQSSSLDSHPIPSVLVITNLSEEEAEEDQLPSLVVFEVDAMTLLLSLYSRSSVMVLMIRKEVLGDSGWERIYEPWTLPREGTVRPRPISSPSELSGYLERTMPVATNQDGNALLQSLRFHVASYDRDFSESLYIKSFVSLEIIFGRIGESVDIAPNGDAKRIAKRVRALIQSLGEEGLLSDDQANWMKPKVPELLRKSAWNQVQDIYCNALSEHGELHLTQQQFTLFLRTRNALAHSGEVEMPGENYQKAFYSLRTGLREYVECLLLVLLGENFDIGRWLYCKSRLSAYFEEFSG